jgi:hypothetical protein
VRFHSCHIIGFLPHFTLGFHVYMLIFMTILKIQGKTFDFIFLSYTFLPWHIDNGFLSTFSFSTVNRTSSFDRTYIKWQTRQVSVLFFVGFFIIKFNI